MNANGLLQHVEVPQIPLTVHQSKTTFKKALLSRSSSDVSPRNAKNPKKPDADLGMFQPPTSGPHQKDESKKYKEIQIT
uniref:TPX2_importin domain-containing protein n=1 Tax=Panagrellus redivivus TaxID=6233 RepID=A0A7E4VE09_PANRE